LKELLSKAQGFRVFVELIILRAIDLTVLGK